MPRRIRRSILIAFLPALLLFQLFAQTNTALAACPASFPATVPASDTARLIELINCANATASNDVINLTNSTYTLTSAAASDSGLPYIVTTATGGTMTINGNGATITRSSGSSFRIFTVNSGANLKLNKMIISGGSANLGGGIYNSGTTLLTEVSVESNTATSGGGGFFNSGTFTLHQSAIINNTSNAYGGGIVNVGGTVNVINTTISGNAANGTGSTSGGGAIDSYGTSPQLNFRSSTIAFNTAVAPNTARSGIWVETGGVFFVNTIIANNNGANNCSYGVGIALTAADGQVDNGTSCNVSGGLQNTDPQLLPLENYGGFTQTHALKPGSPAINLGDNGWISDETGTPLTTDQRGTGFPRLIGAKIDSGAYESACVFTFPYTVPVSDTAALITAIECANQTPTDDVINLTNSTYTLTTGYTTFTGLPVLNDSTVSGSLLINGNGATIRRSSAGGTSNFRLFYVGSNADLTLNDLTLSSGNPSPNRGGAMFVNTDGMVTIENSTISGNSAEDGGAIYNAGEVTILNSTLSNNTAVTSGAGIRTSEATLTVINSTISGNTVTVNGGGAFNNVGGTTQVTLINSTITNNTAGVAARSGIWHEGGSITIQNSIVAGNNGANNCVGTITDNGGNIDNGTSCGFGASSYSNTDPMLAVLGFYGGTTFTHSLLPSSPALNRGIDALAVDQDGNPLTTDQRGSGFSRTIGSRVDIGAYERACVSFPFTVPAGDVGQLVFAIGCANSTSGTQTINLTNSTYTLTSVYSDRTGLPPIANGQLQINGNGATIRRLTAGIVPEFRIMQVTSSGNLRLSELTLQNGILSSIENTSRGGGIDNNGTLTLQYVTLRNNTAWYGGGLANADGSVTYAWHSTITGNTASSWGGGINAAGFTEIVNSTISGNNVTGSSGTEGGGAIRAYSSGELPTIRIINSTIAYNTAGIAARSGIWETYGAIDITNSIVALNGDSGNCAYNIHDRWTDSGNNIDNGTSCQFGGAVGQNTHPMIGALANNGGPTLTHTLLPGSPAINAGNNANAVIFGGEAALTADQRGTGYPRIVATTVDIGAFEETFNNLMIQLPMQGRPAAPNAAYVITVHVTVMPQGGGTPYLTQNFVTNTNGQFTLNLPVGTSTIRVKGTHTLARQFDVTLGAGGQSYETFVLLEGDANNDNSVTLSDFSILASSFSKALGEPGYDARADFNGDNLISLNDFSLLASNYGVTGEG